VSDTNNSINYVSFFNKILNDRNKCRVSIVKSRGDCSNTSCCAHPHSYFSLLQIAILNRLCLKCVKYYYYINYKNRFCSEYTQISPNPDRAVLTEPLIEPQSVSNCPRSFAFGILLGLGIESLLDRGLGFGI
jgi:hypothetical protein